MFVHPDGAEPVEAAAGVVEVLVVEVAVEEVEVVEAEVATVVDVAELSTLAFHVVNL